jgi:hypothetical protein
MQNLHYNYKIPQVHVKHENLSNLANNFNGEHCRHKHISYDSHVKDFISGGKGWQIGHKCPH